MEQQLLSRKQAFCIGFFVFIVLNIWFFRSSWPNFLMAPLLMPTAMKEPNGCPKWCRMAICLKVSLKLWMFSSLSFFLFLFQDPESEIGLGLLQREMLVGRCHTHEERSISSRTSHYVVFFLIEHGFRSFYYDKCHFEFIFVNAFFLKLINVLNDWFVLMLFFYKYNWEISEVYIYKYDDQVH